MHRGAEVHSVGGQSTDDVRVVVVAADGMVVRAPRTSYLLHGGVAGCLTVTERDFVVVGATVLMFRLSKCLEIPLMNAAGPTETDHQLLHKYKQGFIRRVGE